MMKDQDVLEFHDYKQSVLLKMIRIYQETYSDCDNDRCVVEAYNIRLEKQDIDDFIAENHNISTQILIFFLNYIIKYSKITHKIPPFFVVVQSDDYNPRINNVVMSNLTQLDQVPLNKFKDSGNSQNAPIVILMHCKAKWNMIILELQPWIVDFKCDQHTSFPELEGFASEFILNTFGLQIKNFNDHMLDLEQPGDAGDLILYAIYKIFILNLDLMGDTILTKNDYTSSKKKLLWLTLSHLKERTKEDDDKEYTRRLIQKQKEEMLKQQEEEEQRKKEMKNQLSERKKQVYGFLNIIQEPKTEIKQIDTPEQALLKKQLAQFNVTRPRDKVESYLTRMKVREEFQFQYPDPPKFEFPQKDPKAKVKNFLYEVQISNKKPEVIQMITPASYCISQMFSGNYDMPMPKLQRVYDYEMLEQQELQNRERQKLLVKNVNAGGYLSGIGNRLFDRNDYSNGIVFERKDYERIKKEEDNMQRKVKKVDEIQRNIDRLENELFSNYKQ